LKPVPPLVQEIENLRLPRGAPAVFRRPESGPAAKPYCIIRD